MKTWIRKKIGENFRQIRKHQHLTMKEMCSKLGLAETMASYISEIEHGRQGLTEKQLKKFAERLNINISEFYAGVASPDVLGFPLIDAEKHLVEDFRQLPDTFKALILKISNSAKKLMPLSDDEIKLIEKIRYLDIREIKTLKTVLDGLVERKEKENRKDKKLLEGRI